MEEQLMHAGEVSAKGYEEIEQFEKLKISKSGLVDICTKLDKDKNGLFKPFELFVNSFKASPNGLDILTDKEEKQWKIKFLFEKEGYEHAVELAFNTKGSCIFYPGENDTFIDMSLNCYGGILNYL